MNTLRFEIAPSRESNDHQVRIVVDREDWLGPRYLGIDPPEFFAQFSPAEKTELLVGRCGCGVVGCHDLRVAVSEYEDAVVWDAHDQGQLRFERDAYHNLIEQARSDFSWEDINRKAERLVSEIFLGCSLENGFTFNWVSARIKRNIVSLSFSKGREQRVLEFAWDGISIDSAISGARQFRRDRWLCG